MTTQLDQLLIEVDAVFASHPGYQLAGGVVIYGKGSIHYSLSVIPPEFVLREGLPDVDFYFPRFQRMLDTVSRKVTNVKCVANYHLYPKAQPFRVQLTIKLL